MSAEDLERLKTALAIQLEAKKWEYKKQELQFLEAGQHLRSLNQIMWQVPGMAIAVTGGLWYGVTAIEASLPKIMVLLFAAAFDALTILVVWRLRNVIETQICIQRTFSGIPLPPSKERDRLVVRCWAFVLGAASALSLIAATDVNGLSRSKKEDSKPAACSCAISKGMKMSQYGQAQCR